MVCGEKVRGKCTKYWISWGISKEKVETLTVLLKSADVAPEVNLRNSLHTGEKAPKGSTVGIQGIQGRG